MDYPCHHERRGVAGMVPWLGSEAGCPCDMVGSACKAASAMAASDMGCVEVEVDGGSACSLGLVRRVDRNVLRRASRAAAVRGVKGE